MILTKRRYSIIYADPPWTYKVWSEKGTGRSASQHYSLMSNDDIKSLSIQKIAAKDCVLFLWVTGPLLPFGLEVIKSWGFEYKSIAFSWCKQTKHGKWHIGNGYWTRANIELCLLATRGKPKKVSSAVRQLIVSPVMNHSSKPPEVRNRIVELLGNLPRIELFARETCPGWRSVGLEIDGKDIKSLF
jgi:N6-adenosine-specific RNA methylase IME4